MPAEPGADPALAGPPTARVFFALWPPPALAELLAETAKTAAGRFGGRPTRRETIHLTLAFLGEVAQSALPEIVRRASVVKAAPFALQIDCLGFWAHNHLLWAGCSELPSALKQLVADLQQGLVLGGFQPDTGAHGFTPHLSLLRRVPASRAPAPSAPLASLDAPLWTPHSFVLVRSVLSSQGADYRVLAEFPLWP